MAFTDTGNRLADRVATLFSSVSRYDKGMGKASEWVEREFYKSDVLIFVGAVGIAVRLIAPFIKSKDKDPAVVVIDEKGFFAISLLSGHIGGGNKVTTMLAKQIGAVPVVTTATDINGLFAVDTWSSELGCVIDNIQDIKHISSAILKGERVFFKSDFGICGEPPAVLIIPSSSAMVGRCGIYVSLSADEKPFPVTLNVIPRIVTVGIGCRRGTPLVVIEQALIELLSSMKISIKAVSAIASIDLKKGERGILELAEKYKLETAFFTPEELNSVKGCFPSSGFVKGITGVDNVCQRSAALKSGGEIIKEKTVISGITLSVAVSDWRCQF